MAIDPRLQHAAFDEGQNASSHKVATAATVLIETIENRRNPEVPKIAPTGHTTVAP